EQLEMTHFFCKAESQLKGADQDDGISWHGPLFCQLGRSDSGFLPRLSLLRAMSRPHGIQSALTWKIGIPPELESRQNGSKGIHPDGLLEEEHETEVRICGMQWKGFYPDSKCDLKQLVLELFMVGM
ncbi:mCG14725, isoform CRA_a, partial [Mus musculus]